MLRHMRTKNKELQTVRVKQRQGIELTDYDKEVLRVNALCVSMKDEAQICVLTDKEEIKIVGTTKKPKKKRGRQKPTKIEKLQMAAVALSIDQQSHPTRPEQRLIDELDRLNMKYKYQHPLVLPPASY